MMSVDTDVVVVLITAPDAAVAEDLARSMVEEHLVACVNVVPGIKSIYWWEGEINEDREVLLICKAVVSKFDELREFVRKNHPYDTPELVCLDVKDGLEEYLRWVAEVAG